MSRAHLWIECCGSDPLFSSYVYEELHPYRSRVTITIHHENNYEYFGILRLWTRSQQVLSSTLLLYFHSKGLSHKDYSKENNNNEFGIILFNTVIKPWRTILSTFKEKPSIDKIGYEFSPTGIIWYNFFWNRASFTRRLEKPVITNDRYYYEHHNSKALRQDGGYDFRCDNCIGLSNPNPWHMEPSKLFSDEHIGYVIIQDEHKHLLMAYKKNPTVIIAVYSIPKNEKFKDLNI
jgi:hypothetical protein